MSTEKGEKLSKAKLAADFEQAAQLRQHQWDEGAPAHEYQSRIIDKLIKYDPELLALHKKVIDGAAAKAKPSLPKPHFEKKREMNVTGTTNFNPTSFHLEFPWQFEWNTFLPETSDPNASSVRADKTGSMSFFLTTVDGEGHSKSCAMAIGSQFQPPVGSGQMTISVNPFITYRYGNSAVFAAETHGWIGLYVTEVDPNLQELVAVNSKQIVDIWNYTHNSDLGPASQSYPLTVTFSSVPEHVYQIWLWAGGDVSSTGTSYGELSVGLTDMYINLH
jgi:hypothetical protein